MKPGDGARQSVLDAPQGTKKTPEQALGTAVLSLALCHNVRARVFSDSQERGAYSQKEVRYLSGELVGGWQPEEAGRLVDYPPSNVRLPWKATEDAS